MRKRGLCIFFAVALLLLLGIGMFMHRFSSLQKSEYVPEDLAEVVLEFTEIDPVDNRVSFALTNNGIQDFYFLPDYGLDRKLFGTWYRVPMDRPMSIVALGGLTVHPGETVRVVRTLSNYYDDLSSGTYRIHFSGWFVNIDQPRRIGFEFEL